MRDKIKSEQYYESYLTFLDKTIDRFEGLSETGDETKGYKPLRKYYLDKINVLHSNGSSILDIRQVYFKFLKCFIHTWTSNDGYEVLLNAVSLAVLLNVGMNDFKSAIDFLKADGINDIIIDSMLNYIDPAWKVQNNVVQYPLRYALLGDIIKENDNSRQANLLDQYLKEWYEKHCDAAWYDSHKSKEDIYTGYWSYEAGAMAKIMKLDDSAIKDADYYPYDLVHYKS